MTVNLSAADAQSGVAATHYRVDRGDEQTGTSVSITAEGVHTLEYWSVDGAGNTEDRKTVAVRIDRTPPTITHEFTPLPTNGWFNGEVRVKFICEDSLSEIKSCSPDRVLSEEGADQDATGEAVDNAGNKAVDPVKVSIDRTPPTIEASPDRAANDQRWYSDDVTVSFTCGDTSRRPYLPARQDAGRGQGPVGDRDRRRCGRQHQERRRLGVNVDKTEPELSGEATPKPNDNGWYKNDVVVKWNASDALSGLDGDEPADSTVNDEGENLSASASVKDKAGNARALTVDGIKIDRAAPTTTVDVAKPLASGWYAAAVNVTLTGVDGLSGVDDTLYSVDGGDAQLYEGAFDFDQKGMHTITFWSVDKAGNEEKADDVGHSITLRIDGIAPSIVGRAFAGGERLRLEQRAGDRDVRLQGLRVRHRRLHRSGHTLQRGRGPAGLRRRHGHGRQHGDRECRGHQHRPD